MRSPATMVALLAAGVAVAGCGGSNDSGAASSQTTPADRTVDTSSVESGIKQQFSSSGANVTDVNCPSGEKAQAGTTFDCKVTWSNGAAGKVKVTEPAPNKFSYSIVSGSVQIPGSTVDKELERQLAKEGAPNAIVDCPDNIVVKENSAVTCDVSGAGGKVGGSVTFTFSSAEGTIDSSSVTSG